MLGTEVIVIPCERQNNRVYSTIYIIVNTGMHCATPVYNRVEPA